MRMYSWSLVYRVVMVRLPLRFQLLYARLYRCGVNGRGATFARQRLAAHHEVQFGAGRGDLARDVAHGDRAVHGRAEAARGDDPDLAAVRRRDRRALAGRRAAFGLEPDADPRTGPRRSRAARGPRPGSRPPAGGVSGSTRRALPRPGTWWCRCRGRRGTDPPRDEGSRARRGRSASPPGSAKERPPEGSGLVGLDGDLEPVLARVARSGDVAAQARDLEPARRHEGQVGGIRRRGGASRLRPRVPGARTAPGRRRAPGSTPEGRFAPIWAKSASFVEAFDDEVEDARLCRRRRAARSSDRRGCRRSPSRSWE